MNTLALHSSTQRWYSAMLRALLTTLASAACHSASHAQDAAPPPASVASAASAPAAPPAPPLPTEAFARLPLVSQVALSPDGRRIAALLNQADRTVLITRAIDGSALSAVLDTDNQRFLFNWVGWVSSERLLVSVSFTSRRESVGTVETRLISVRADGSGAINLVIAAPRERHTGPQQIQDRVIDWLPGDGQHVLLQLSEGDVRAPAVFKVNVETGARERVQSSMRDVIAWTTDAQHRVRIGKRLEEDKYHILACDPDGKNWRTLWTYKPFSKEQVTPLGFGKNPQELFVQADHQGRKAVFSVDLDSPDLKRTLRLADPKYDLGGRLLRSPLTGEVVGVQSGGMGSDEDSRADLWDSKLKELAVSVDKRLPKLRNRLQQFSRDESRYLVYSIGNGLPGQYYLGNRETGELVPLIDEYPQLEPHRLVGKQVTKFRARDGLELTAYLSRPAGAGDKPLPLVLFPHGGPQSSDDADFDVWTEFLASRGYAVLQVDFRGSSGYGHAFTMAGLKRWGLEMQDDLTDAVQWAVAQGVAEPGRACIVGASYGGYAALMGAIKTPQLYRCAVSFAGVTDLIDQIRFERDFLGGDAWAEAQIGSIWDDRQRLRATSPALNAERIAVPVLLVHGTDDRIVPVEQGRDMAQALKKAGKRYRYVEQEGGNHHLSRYSHRLQFFELMEGFLAEHLGANAPMARSP